MESFADGLLEWPQYSRPTRWSDHAVPPVLLSGHEARIERGRLLMQVLETLKKKPWMLADRKLDSSIWELLAEAIRVEENGDQG
ncbi:MAG: tRNA (guanosine(37)-N1)-methyltransferase TrmD, partial [Deltaproteobacteria bacterium]|nr:tRNA (guanosine(37)-N1)-methyltransferase TrmD [Deltaproteobacteria bacterium]